MSLPTIKIIETSCNVEETDLADLTQTALGSLIWECEQLLDKLKNAEAGVKD